MPKLIICKSKHYTTRSNLSIKFYIQPLDEEHMYISSKIKELQC